MKAPITFALLSLSALTSAVALPEPNPSPEPWCSRRGQSCWKVKRAIDAFTGTLAERDVAAGSSPSDELAKRASHLPGGASYVAKRALDDLATIIASTHDEDAQHFYDNLPFDDEDDTVPEEEAHLDARDLAADKRWCSRVGQSCWKAKRAATAVIDALEARDVEGLAKRGEDLEARWCSRVGQSCWKRSEDVIAARDVHAIMNAARDVLEAVN